MTKDLQKVFARIERRPPVPPHVQAVLSELSHNPTVKSIWLIGSRACGTAGSRSDWDLLAFCSTHARVRPQLHCDVDVLRVGPDEKLLLDGRKMNYLLDFKEWQWKSVSSSEASYIGRHFTGEVGVARDCDEPHFEETQARGLLLWSKDVH